MAGVQIIDVPGQGEIEFPADMADDQIAAAIKRIQLSPMQKRMGLGKQGDTMGDIHRARNNLIYEAGGKLTDLTGSPALGAAANVITDIATDPLTYAGGAFGKALEPAAQAAGKSMMWRALKPARAARMNGDAEKAVQTLLDEGVNVTKGGVESLTARIDTLDDALDQAIKGSTARLQKTDALKGLKDVIKEYKAGTMAAESLDDVRRVARNLIEHPQLRGKTDMSVQAAQAMKRQNYKELGDAAYGTGLKPSAERDALKAVTRSLKEGIERGTPEAGAINAEMSPLINARDLAQDRTLVAGNRDLLGISTMNPKTMLLSLADRSQLLKSLLARFLYSGVAPAVAPVGAATGGGIGSLLEQQGQK